MPARPTDREQVLAQLGECLRSARAESGLTQERLALDSGVSLRMVQQIEAGTANPSIYTLTKLARLLTTTPADLLNGIA